MINWIKSWIRAVVREETSEASTLRGIKPGQVFNVTNADGSVDRVTVRGAAKAAGKAPAKRKAKASSEKGRKP